MEPIHNNQDLPASNLFLVVAAASCPFCYGPPECSAIVVRARSRLHVDEMLAEVAEGEKTPLFLPTASGSADWGFGVPLVLGPFPAEFANSLGVRLANPQGEPLRTVAAATKGLPPWAR